MILTLTLTLTLTLALTAASTVVDLLCGGQDVKTSHRSLRLTIARLAQHLGAHTARLRLRLHAGRPAPLVEVPRRPPKAVLQQHCRTAGVPPPRYTKLPQVPWTAL